MRPRYPPDVPSTIMRDNKRELRGCQGGPEREGRRAEGRQGRPMSQKSPGPRPALKIGHEKYSIGQDLAAEDLLEPRVVESGDKMKDARPVCAALGDQEM